MFFCDPPGRTDPDSLYNHGHDVTELHYIFFHDQEPIHLDIHKPLFDEVHTRNLDLNNTQGPVKSAIITSEQNSDTVDRVCEQYNWKHFYYFFHGWASLDWYRGYDKTYLIPPYQTRKINKTFIAPNRIIAGKRLHRLNVLYHIFKNNMHDNWISCPAVCPVENISIVDAAKPLLSTYPDIQDVFASQVLPIDFPGETGAPMHSCWLSLFDQAADSLLYLVTETVADGRRHHITEKTFKPIAMGMPFVLVATQGSLEYLRSYGFKTFEGIWDESYDNEPDDTKRIERIASLLKSLDELTVEGKRDLFEMALPVIQHNWNHFYNGGFEAVLWTELQGMLAEMDCYFHD
jgi:hypothetical protein